MVEGDDIEEVEEHPRTGHNPMSTGDIAGVEQDSKAKNHRSNPGSNRDVEDAIEGNFG
jgi:hypothetical protein